MQGSDQKQKKTGLKRRLMKWLGLTREVTIKVYHGYGHAQLLNLHGHVFKFSPLPRKKYRQSFVRNTWALLRLFMVRPYADVEVVLDWNGQLLTARTDCDGFFKFEWKDERPLTQGWQPVVVQARNGDTILARGEGHIFIPYRTQYGFISDIDDTFLISHSSNLRKRLFVLFTENARSRKPFEGVVRHYQLLAHSFTTPEAPNPFFFVSSSEWNLYDYIVEFAAINEIPRGIYLLNQLKRFNQLLKTGQNNHKTKFTRIARIMEHYPDQKFILLGDSSQQDPYIYEAIVSHFPRQVHAVYIRNVSKKNEAPVEEVLKKIEEYGIHCCFFAHSSEAIAHSQKIGLISESRSA